MRGWGNGLPEARVTRKPAPATPDRVLSFLANDAENVTRSFPPSSWRATTRHDTRTTHSAYSMSDARRTGRVLCFPTVRVATAQIVTQLGTATAGRIVVPASPETTASPAEVECVPHFSLSCIITFIIITPPMV